MAQDADDRQVLQESDLPPKRRFTLYCCYKWLVFIHGLFFLIVGLLLLGVGLAIATLRTSYSSINDLLGSPSILAVVVGIVMVITAMTGIVGALKEHLVLLKIFLFVIVLVFLIQVIIGIIAFIYREEAIGIVNDQLSFALRGYHENARLAQGVDAIQRDFKCCGLRGYRDWEKNEEYKCGALSDVECSVPDSCCRQIQEHCGLGVRGNNTIDLAALLQSRGCSWHFLMWVEENLDLVGALALGFALPQLCGIFLVAAFIIKVRDYRRLFNYRKRMYQK